MAEDADNVEPTDEIKKQVEESRKQGGRNPRPKKTENSVSPAPAPERNAVVGNADTDPVYLSKIVYRNIASKKSLSVHHVQRRLNDLGYTDAYADKDGYYGDLTKSAIESFQKDHDLLVTGIVDEGTLAAIFDGDPNVSVKFN